VSAVSAVTPGHARARAVRLTFAYDRNGVRLIDRTPVDKRVPAGADVSAALAVAAVGAELRTAGGEATYRTLLGPYDLPQTTEVFDPAAEHGVYRVARAPATGSFSVIVPDDGRTEEVVLVAGPGSAAPGAAATPADPASGAQVIARFPWREGGDDGQD
jgi:hypothetical protein